MSNATGFKDGGMITTDYPGIGDGIPLLSSFYFRFEAARLPPSPQLPNPPIPGLVDNRIESIHVLPGGLSEDLSPWADLAPSQVPADKIQLMFQDKDGNDRKDRYFYNVTHTILPAARARRFQFQDVGCTGKCEQILPPPPSGGGVLGSSVFVLADFKLYFTGTTGTTGITGITGSSDNDLDRIAVFEDDGKLTVEFRNKIGDELNPTFGYLVDYAWVKRRPTDNILTGEASGSATRGDRTTVPVGPKVICGFSFDFKSKDRHLHQIGIMTFDDKLEVYYSDRTPNDQFDWTVRWASVTPPVIG